MFNKYNIFIVIALFLYSYSLYSQKSLEENVEQLHNDLKEIEDIYLSTEAKYLSPLLLKSDYKKSYSQRLSRGDYYFERKDYISSGSIYYSIFSSRNEKDVIWEEALYKLAESLFLNRNYISATRYYEMLITSKPNSRFYIECLKRLISASYYLGEYSKAKNYYSEFMGIGYDISEDEELIYFLGKSLFYDKQYQDAENIFKTIVPGTTYYPQAQYFLGVLLLKNKRFNEAAKSFSKIINLKKNSKYRKLKNIKDLALLALGRISFEQDDLITATDYYLKMERNSEFFAQAYFELCWTYIKKEEYEKAIEVLRLLKYISPGSILVPKADVLEGNLLIKTRRYSEAMVLFNKIVEKYGKIKTQLTTLDDKGLSLSINKKTSDNVFLVFSPLVRSLLKDDKSYNHAVQLKDDIQRLESQLQQVEQIESKLSIIIGNKNAATIFPPLKKGTEITVALQNKMAKIKNRLIELKKKVFWSQLNKKEKKKFNELQKKKGKLKKQIESMPLSGEEIEKKASEYAQKIVKMEEQLHRINLQTKSFMDQLESINAYYIKQQSGNNTNPEVFKSIENEKKNIKAIVEKMKKYKDEIKKEKNRLLLGGDMISKMIITRNSYDNAVREQSKIFDKAKKSTVSINSKIDSLELQALELSKRIDKFYVELNDVIKNIILKLKQSYEEERMRLAEYKSQLMVLKREVEELATLSMFSNISKVKTSFSDLVLQADLGIIDVAWEKKEEASKKILRYRTKMAQEIQQLYLNLENIE